MSKVLVVDDDVNISVTVKDILEYGGYLVDLASSAAEADDVLAVSQYDLIILDWEMSLVSGVEFLQKVRSKGLQVPVLMLTGRGSIDDKETGFDCGADDYLVKPFDSRELMARVKALLRRKPLVETSDIRIGEFSLDTKGRRLYRADAEISLTKQEYALLELLMRNPDEVFSADAIMSRAWSAWSDCSPDTVRVHITHLRKKLGTGTSDSPIRTLHRQGYMFSST